MMVKLEIKKGHSVALKKFLCRVEKYNLRLNSKECVIGVTLGKMLGYIVSQKRTIIDPSEAKMIIEMPVPNMDNEIKDFLGKL